MKEIIALKRKWILLLIPISLIIIVICKNSAFIAEYVFARGIYRILAILLGLITRWFPFSIAEMCIYLLPILGVFFLGRVIYRAVKDKEHRFLVIGKAVLNLLCFLAIVLTAFVLLCGVNYYRYSFTTYLNYEAGTYSKDDLYNLCNELADKLNEAREDVQVNDDGEMKLSYKNNRELLSVASTVMSEFMSDYPAYKYSTGAVKPVLASKYMSYTDIVGIYIPFTMEANINVDVTDYNHPVDALHELAHLRGVMPEDEANFVAYLAYISSNEADFVYSGYMLAYILSSNQLYDEDKELYMKVRNKLSEGVLKDIYANSAYWKQFETETGNKIANVSNKVNDTYLNLNGQTEGTKSYGMMVDLLIAEYKEKENDDSKKNN
mgnify:CR=1 FL=1